MILYQMFEIHILRMTLLEEVDILQVRCMVLKQLSFIYYLWFQYPTI